MSWRHPARRASPATTQTARTPRTRLRTRGFWPPLPPGEDWGEGWPSGAGDVALTLALSRGERGPDSDPRALAERERLAGRVCGMESGPSPVDHGDLSGVLLVQESPRRLRVEQRVD